MAVTKKEILELRRQLRSDRELIGNDEAAKPFLDFQERNIEDLENSWAKRDPIAALDHVLSEIEVGTDSATSEEISELAADIREWEAALETVPTENRGLPLFKIAERAVSILKQNCIALADKSDLQERILGVIDSTKRLRAELEEVTRLIYANAELNLGVTRTVFEHFRNCLLPALDSVLDKSLGDILAGKQ